MSGDLSGQRYANSAIATAGRRAAWFLCVLFALTFLCAPSTLGGEIAQKPKVRAITAFIRLDRANYQVQVQDTLKMLRRAKAAIERGGYEVESIRVTTQPFTEYTRGLSKPEALAFFRAYDELAIKESFDANIGPAMLRDTDDSTQAELLAEVLSTTKSLNASLVTADEDGIHWNSVRAAAKVIKFVAEHSPHSQGTFNFAATAMMAPYGPFYPGSYHTGAGHQFSVALEGANVVDQVFTETVMNPRLAAGRLAQVLGEPMRAVEQIALEVEKESGWSYVGIDPTPAPLREVSIGAAIEKFTGVRFGAGGTLTAASVITQAVRSVRVKQVGYSGLMLPIMEDSRLAQRWSEGAVSLDALLAYSAVCGTGLDTIPLPGDVSVEQLERILGDVAALAVKWHKPLSARLQPVVGKKAGDRTEFDDPFLVNTIIQALP